LIVQEVEENVWDADDTITSDDAFKVDTDNNSIWDNSDEADQVDEEDDDRKGNWR